VPLVTPSLSTSELHNWCVRYDWVIGGRVVLNETLSETDASVLRSSILELSQRVPLDETIILKVLMDHECPVVYNKHCFVAS